jgi:ribosomal-protein-alanine N-acetyltransferase
MTGAAAPEGGPLPVLPVEPIRAGRVILRQWIESDRQPFAALNADPEVMRYFPSTLTREQSDAFVDRTTMIIGSRGWGLWAVESEGRFLGFTGLSVPGFDGPFEPGSVEVGWRFARFAWGRGLATEAARAAVDVAFSRLGLTQLVSFTAVGNERSRAVMRRLGMTHDPADAFEHPRIAVGDPLRPHVLYRLRAGRESPEATAVR